MIAECYTMFDLRTVNGLAVMRHAFGLFNWTAIETADFVSQSQSN